MSAPIKSPIIDQQKFRGYQLFNIITATPAPLIFFVLLLLESSKLEDVHYCGGKNNGCKYFEIIYVIISYSRLGLNSPQAQAQLSWTACFKFNTRLVLLSVSLSVSPKDPKISLNITALYQIISCL